jgi:hypothetical protein
MFPEGVETPTCVVARPVGASHCVGQADGVEVNHWIEHRTSAPRVDALKEERNGAQVNLSHLGAEIAVCPGNCVSSRNRDEDEQERSGESFGQKPRARIGEVWADLVRRRT